MCCFRVTLAVFALALVAGPAAAQVTDSIPSPINKPDSKPPATADPVANPTPINLQPTPQSEHVSAVPEPGTLTLAGLTAVAWVTYWRRRWRADPTGTGPATQP